MPPSPIYTVPSRPPHRVQHRGGRATDKGDRGIYQDLIFGEPDMLVCISGNLSDRDRDRDRQRRPS